MLNNDYEVMGWLTKPDLGARRPPNPLTGGTKLVPPDPLSQGALHWQR
jgi:hypothetical protein